MSRLGAQKMERAPKYQVWECPQGAGSVTRPYISPLSFAKDCRIPDQLARIPGHCGRRAFVVIP